MRDREPNAIRLSIVIPAYNCESLIAATLGTVIAYLAGKPFAAEIVVVDDGSADRTAETARQALAGRIFSKVISRGFHLGKGASVREGVLASAGQVILFSDDDLSTPIAECDRLLAALDAGADVAIGSRALPESVIKVRQRRPRECLGKTFNWLVRVFVLKEYRDTQCGFKAFRRAAAMDLFSRLHTAGFAFDVEVLVFCRELGYRVAEVPITWIDFRPSRLGLFKGSLGMLKELWHIRRDARRRRAG